MLKITVEISENKGKDSCNVKIKYPKDVTKASESERIATANVGSKIEQAIKELHD